MKTSKEKVLAALSGLVSEDARKEVDTVVDAFLDECKVQLEEEYNAKLEEAYAIVANEKVEAEKVAEQGYSEALQLIKDLRDRLEIQNEEFQKALDEGYEEAYEMLVAERNKNENITIDLYEEYDKKLAEIKDYIVDKVSQFLDTKGDEFYEQIERDYSNDPAKVEHKIALEKISEVVSGYWANSDYNNISSSKIEEATRNLEEIKGQVKILEAKNMKLATENHKLNEAVRHQNELISEQVNNESRERVKKARSAEGRGQKVVDNSREIVIGEHTAVNETVTEQDDRGTRFVEQIGEEITRQWQVLAGQKSDK